MEERSILLRCASCKAVNRVPARRLGENPRCGKCKVSLPVYRSPVEVSAANFDREVIDHPGLVVLFFWAPWCAHCMSMLRILEELARQRWGELKVCMANTEKEPILAGRFHVLSVPRLVLYRNGRVLDELSGAVQRRDLEAWISQAASRS